jgi:Icc-related predicted phosphoesterase
LNRAAALLDRESILVVHPPPRGVLDTAFGRFHVGSSGLRRFVERYQPRVVICGHVHECAGSAVIAETMVVNCSMGPGNTGVLIEYNPGCKLKISMI